MATPGIDFLEIAYDKEPVFARSGTNPKGKAVALYFRINTINENAMPALMFFTGYDGIKGNAIFCYPKGVTTIDYVQYRHTVDGVEESWNSTSWGTRYDGGDFYWRNATIGQSPNYYTNGDGVYPEEHSYEEAMAIAAEYYKGEQYPIQYRSTKCSFPNAPEEAAVGDTVNVDCAFPVGYGATQNDIRVTCNGSPLAFSWNGTNKRITFTMPDPAE